MTITGIPAPIVPGALDVESGHLLHLQVEYDAIRPERVQGFQQRTR
jgi:hypothetical protein